MAAQSFLPKRRHTPERPPAKKESAFFKIASSRFIGVRMQILRGFVPFPPICRKKRAGKGSDRFNRWGIENNLLFLPKKATKVREKPGF
jgi:hypothetical protein